MAASKRLTPEQRSLRARLAAHAGWANTTDRTARTAHGAKASPGSVEYWLSRVDPDGVMTPDNRQKAATSARAAHMARLAFSRSKKAKGGGTDAPAA